MDLGRSLDIHPPGDTGMFRLWQSSIGFRLNLLFVLIVTLLLTVSGMVSYFNTRHVLEEQYQEIQQRLRERLKISLPPPIWDLDTRKIEQNIEAEIKSPVRGIEVYGEENTLMAKRGAGSKDASLDKLEFHLSYQRGNENAEIGRAVAYLSRDEMNSALRVQVLYKFVEIVLLDLVLLAALSISLSRNVLSPLRQLKEALNTAAEATDSSGEIQLPEVRKDELGEVARGFNRISQRLADDLERRSVAEDQIRKAYDELKSTQDNLVQAEKLAALGSLVAGVAHEINTPVGVTVTSATLLAQETRKFKQAVDGGAVKKSDVLSYAETASESSELILANAERAAHLIQSFKLVAVDQTSEARRYFDVGGYIDEIITSLRPKFKRTSVAIKNECRAGIRVDSYPGAFAQVVTNFAMNALMHAFEEGQAGLLTIRAKKEDERVVIEFEDNGRGISPEHLPRIFEPFFTTRRGTGGSGLGLNIVYNIITKKLGGQIQVKSVVGKGTLFILTLPLAAPTPGEPNHGGE